MVRPWSEIEQRPDYQSLPPDQQMQLKQRYDAKAGTVQPVQQAPVVNQPVQQTQPQIASDQLIKRLGGKLPMSEQEFQKLERTVSGEPVPSGKSITYTANPKKMYAEELYRRKVYNDLVKQGNDPEQIKAYTDVQKQMQRFPLGRSVGAAIGSVALPALMNLIPGALLAPEEAVTIPLGRKIGQLAGGVVGAGLGGGAGETAQIGYEEQRLASMNEFKDAALTEMATEAGMRGIGAGGKALLSNLVKQSVPEAAKTIEEFSKAGGLYTPAQMDKRLLVRAGEEAARGGFGAKEIFDDIAERNVSSVKLYSDRILDSLAQGAVRKGSIELGQEFAEGITSPSGRTYRMIDELFDPLFKQIEQESRGARINTKLVKALAQREIANDIQTKGISLTPKGRAMLTRITQLGDTMKLSDMRTIRSALLAEGRNMGRDLDRSEALIKRLASAVDKSIFDTRFWEAELKPVGGELAYKGLTPQGRTLLENTNRLYRSTMDAFETTFPQKLIKQLQNKPADVTKQIFKPKNPLAVRQLRQSLIEPVSGRPSEEGKVLWNQLRTAWLADVVDNASKEGRLNYHTIDAAFRNLGDDVLKEMYPGADYKQIQNIRDTFKVLTKKPSAGASLFIRGGQVRGAQMIGGGLLLYKGTQDDNYIALTAGGLLLLSPYIYARLATSSSGRKLLTAGLKKGLTPTSRSYAPTVARIVNLASKLDRLDRQQIVKEREAPERAKRWESIVEALP